MKGFEVRRVSFVSAAVIAAVLFVSGTFFASAQDDFIPEGDTYVIREPAAWTRPKGEVAVSMGFTPWVVRGEIGIVDYVTVGVAYGGANVLGYGNPDFNPYPAFQIKFRITNGGAVLPAVSVGYDDQGQGRYLDGLNPYLSKNEGRAQDYNRFVIKAKGFYGVASQEYGLLGALGFHFGLNYNVREKNDDDTMNVFCAVEKTVGSRLMLLATYDAGFNDDNKNALSEGHGFLNTGVRWHVSDDFDLDFYVTNVLNNQETRLGYEGKYSRMLFITYKWSL